jgi:3-hydroxybutyryl-CoA dehydratase
LPRKFDGQSKTFDPPHPGTPVPEQSLASDGHSRLLPRGVYGFADLRDDDRIVTGQVTVSAEDIDRFADLSGDRFAIHMSDMAAQEAGFASRVAHGLLVLSLIDGLKNQSPAQLRAVASLGWQIGFRAPVLAGDTLSAVFRVETLRPTRDRQRGIAVLAVDAHNQRGEVVQRGRTTLMMRP